ALGRGVFAFQDILDQPKAAFFLIVEPSPIHPQTFLVDKVDVQPNIISAKRGATLVTAFSPTIPWYMVSAEYVEMITTEEMAHRTAADDKVTSELRKKLYPKGKEHKHDSDDEPESLHTGQYA